MVKFNMTHALLCVWLSFTQIVNGFDSFCLNVGSQFDISCDVFMILNK